jgi:hypothetical protein
MRRRVVGAALGIALLVPAHRLAGLIVTGLDCDTGVLSWTASRV